VKSFIREIVLGLQYLHSNSVIFVDLKPANILINEYGNLKLADLGSAKKLTDMMQT
jgi:serine/threonine protein kinase